MLTAAVLKGWPFSGGGRRVPWVEYLASTTLMAFRDKYRSRSSAAKAGSACRRLRPEALVSEHGHVPPMGWLPSGR